MPPSHQPSSTLFLFLLFFFVLLLLPHPTSAVAKKEPPPPSSSLLVPPQTEDELEGDEGTAAWLSSLSTEDVLSSSSSMSSDSFSSFHSALAMTEDEEEEAEEEEEEEEGREENQTQEDDSDDDTASLEALLSAPALEDKRAESPWVRRFCQSPGHEFFCVVPASFIAEEFNWLGLPYDLEGIDLLLGKTLPHVGSSSASAAAAATPSSIEDEALFMAARRMYGLIHARFIVTQKGLNAMKAKFEAAEFGRCPRLACEAQAVLPMGTREMGAANQEGQEDDEEEEGKNGNAAVDVNGGGGGGVQVFCPSCRQVYRPENAYHQSLDGMFWGSSFAHLFMLAFPELCPPLDKGVEMKESKGPAGGEEVLGRIREDDGTRMKNGSKKRKRRYVPRVFGFRVVEEEELALQVKEKEKEKDKLPAEEEGVTLSAARPPPPTTATITSPTAAAPRRKAKPSPLSALLTRATRTNKGRIAVWQISRIGKPSRDKHHHPARRLLPLLVVPPLSLLFLVLKKRSSDFFSEKEEEIIIPPPSITHWTFEWPGDLFSAPKQGKR